MRILIIGACPFPAPQGSQVYLRETALALQHAGHDVRLLTYGHGAGQADPRLVVHRARRLPGGGRIRSGPSVGKPLQDASLLKALQRVRRDFRPQVYCAHNAEALAVGVAARARPLVYFPHNLLGEELPTYGRVSALLAPVGRRFDRAAPRRADAVVAPSAALAKGLAACGVAAERLFVVPPPFEAHGPVREPESSAAPPVLYMGNLDRYQDLDLLAAAMTHVRHALPQTEWWVASHQQPRFPDCRHFPTPDAAALLEVLAHDLVVALPRHRTRGYPIKLLNAMTAAKPVVACEGAVGDLRHGEHALLAAPAPEAFGNALLECLRDGKLRRRLGQAGRGKLEAEHAYTAVAPQLEAALNYAVRSPI